MVFYSLHIEPQAEQTDRDQDQQQDQQNEQTPEKIIHDYLLEYYNKSVK